MRDLALDHLCSALRTLLRPADILGSLTGNDLAALVFADANATLHVHLGTLIQALADRPFRIGARPLELNVACGMALVTRWTDVDGVIAAADADLTANIRA